jgi:hypothetical protein
MDELPLMGLIKLLFEVGLNCLIYLELDSFKEMVECIQNQLGTSIPGNEEHKVFH